MVGASRHLCRSKPAPFGAGRRARCGAHVARPKPGRGVLHVSRVGLPCYLCPLSLPPGCKHFSPWRLALHAGRARPRCLRPCLVPWFALCGRGFHPGPSRSDWLCLVVTRFAVFVPCPQCSVERVRFEPDGVTASDCLVQPAALAVLVPSVVDQIGPAVAHVSPSPKFSQFVYHRCPLKLPLQ